MKKREIMKKIQDICLNSKNPYEILKLVMDSNDRDFVKIRNLTSLNNCDFRQIWNITYNFTNGGKNE